jgi:non-canonical poly(A) RNA polymerase PAPD5/7
LFLHSEILDFTEFISATKEDAQIRKQVVDRITRVIAEEYPLAKVCVFGSCATGLNLPKSDIDLLCYYPEVREQTLLNKLTNKLARSNICSSIEPIKSAKCPIIKLTDKQSGINVDISFNRDNGIHCVHLVKQLMRKYPELKPLLLVLKCFLKSRQLNETYHGGVSSFLLTMLVVSHLQRQYKRYGPDVDVDLGKHLIDFFELYGTLFNYEDVGISIRSGYFTKESRNWEGYDDKSRFRLCVENPQDVTVDIGKACFNIKRVQRAF